MTEAIMRFKLIVLGVILLLSGCFHTVKTGEIALNLQSGSDLTLGLSKKDISVADTKYNFHSPLFISNLLLDTLMAESNGRVVPPVNQPLSLSITYDFQPEFQPNIFIGVTSLFIPILGFIPESNEERYRVEYAVKDPQGTVVYQRSLENTVEGSIKGWYVGRIGAATNLKKAEALLAAKNAARLVLKDLDEHSGKILAAVRSARIPSTASGRHFNTTAAQDIIRSTPQESLPSAAAVSSDVDELPSKKAKAKNAYAIVIGIETYRQKLPPADFAVRDASTITEYLTKVLGYPEENVITLLNDRALQSDLAKYFEKWLPNNVEQGNTVFVYYSGHGAPNPKTGDAYLVPYDGDPTFITETGYSLKRMYDALGKLPAKEIIIALDSCFSGAGGRSVIAKGSRPLVVNLQTNIVLSKNMTVLSASSDDQTSSAYAEKGHGLFTYFLLKAIKNEDVVRKDGSLKIEDLYDYLKPQVERVARKQYNNEQMPQLIYPK